MGKRDLPDIYALARGRGHIYIYTSKHICPIVQEQMSAKALSSIQSINFTVDHSTDSRKQQQQHWSIENLITSPVHSTVSYGLV